MIPDSRSCAHFRGPHSVVCTWVTRHSPSTSLPALKPWRMGCSIFSHPWGVVGGSKQFGIGSLEELESFGRCKYSPRVVSECIICRQKCTENNLDRTQSIVARGPPSPHRTESPASLVMPFEMHENRSLHAHRRIPRAQYRVPLGEVSCLAVD